MIQITTTYIHIMQVCIEYRSLFPSLVVRYITSKNTAATDDCRLSRFGHGEAVVID